MAVRSEVGVWPVFVGICFIAVLARIWLFASPGVPSGIDGGGWLAFGHDLLGGRGRSGGGVYPPIVPLIVTGSVHLFGAPVGVAIVAAMSAVAPAVGVFVVLRRAGLGVAAVILATALLGSASIGEIASWGGYPQLLASPASLAGLWFLDRWLLVGHRRDLAIAALAGVTVLGVSHVAALPAALAALIVVGWRWATASDRRRIRRRVGAAIGVEVICSLPVLPMYAHLLPAWVGSRGAEPTLALIRWNELPSRFVSVFGPTWFVWVAAIGVGIWALVFRRSEERSLPVVAAALALAIVGGFAITREPRLLYDVPCVGAVGVGLWLNRRSPGPRALRLVAVSLLAGVVVAAGIVRAVPQRDRFRVLDRDLLDAIAWIAEETPAGARIGVASLGDAPLGWWVEGLTGRPTISGAPLRWLVFPGERLLAGDVNRLFFVDGVPSTAAMRRARSLGIDLLLLPKGSIAYDAHLIDGWSASGPVFENRSALVFAVPDPVRVRVGWAP